MPDKEVVLQVFSKVPIKGQVKTRLIPAIGDVNAAKLYEELFQHTMHIALGSVVDAIQVWCSPSVEAACFQSYSDYEKISIHEQRGENLGERMLNSIEDGLKNFRKCIVIGCDCPGLDTVAIHESVSLLDNSNVVLGPAIDGGYYLLAVNKVDSNMFKNVEWSTASVLEQTANNLQSLGWSQSRLKPLRDIDEEEDLFCLKEYGLGEFLLEEGRT